MDSKEFSKVVKKQQTACSDVLIAKGEEYSSDVDKLHNFKIAAAVRGCSQKQALAGMMAKHTVSLYDMIRSDQPFSMATWDEKITDHLNYLLLLKAIVVEEQSIQE